MARPSPRERISRSIDMRILVLPGAGIGPQITDAWQERAASAAAALG
jgi:hypothetical protein